MLAGHFGNFPADDARNAVSCEAESSRKHFRQGDSSFCWTIALFTATEKRRRNTGENSYIYSTPPYLSASQVFIPLIINVLSPTSSSSFHLLSNLRFPPIRIGRKRKMWRKNDKLDAQLLRRFTPRLSAFIVRGRLMMLVTVTGRANEWFGCSAFLCGVALPWGKDNYVRGEEFASRIPVISPI